MMYCPLSGKKLGRPWMALLAVCALLALCAAPASAARIQDLCDIQGARGNILKGIGIVVGLAGTGDKAGQAIASQERMLDRLGIDVEDIRDLKTDNSAIVIVTGEIVAFSKEGTRIDVKVASLYDCESLEGGTLLETHLLGPGLGETVYAVAQGPISVGGFNASGGGGGASVTKNHVTAGRIPMGAYIEREVPSTITDGARLLLLMKRPDFTNANVVQEAVNATLGPDSAVALGAGTIRVTIPESSRANLIAFIAQLQSIDVRTHMSARIVVNERTGTIVVGGEVMIKPCHVAHGSLTIKVAVTPEVTPALSFTDAEAVVTETVDLVAEEEEAFLMPVEGTSAGEIAQALNQLRVTPRDMISIFQALREAGALEADLEVM